MEAQREVESSRRSRQVAAEQVALLYRQAPASLFAVLINASIITYTLWSLIAPPVLLGWFSCNLVLTAIRVVLIHRYHRTTGPADQAALWQRWFLIGSGLSGLLWGAASLLLFPNASLPHQVFLVFMIGGMAGGSIVSLSAVFPGCVSFALPAMLPLAGQFFLQDNELSFIMGFPLLGALSLLLLMAYRSHLTIVESLRLRFDNIDLVAQLSEAKAQAENAREQAEAARAQAEAANQAKSAFLANMSHELRTPLHGILSFSSFGLKKAATVRPEKLVFYFQHIHSSGDLLLSLLNDLLDLAKLEVGKMHFEWRTTDLNRLLPPVIEEFQAQLAEQQLTLHRHLPSSPSPVVLDATRIQQVVRNLLGNAVKFSPPSGTIQLAVEHREQTVRLSVADNGPGIPAGELDAVFEKFIQSSHTRTNAGGTGLGLAICREIVIQHQGAIWAENRAEGGAIFWVELPLANRSL